MFSLSDRKGIIVQSETGQCRGATASPRLCFLLNEITSKNIHKTVNYWQVTKTLKSAELFKNNKLLLGLLSLQVKWKCFTTLLSRSILSSRTCPNRVVSLESAPVRLQQHEQEALRRLYIILAFLRSFDTAKR